MTVTRLTITTMLALICLSLNGQGHRIKDNFLITDDGIKLFVKKSGNGPVCIFIHGGPGAWSKSFEELKGNALETSLSIVYYDQRGSGRSGKSKSGDYSLDRMIKDIDLIRKHFHAEKVYLLSHSFGGILAVNYALKYPDGVKGLILANSTLNLPYSLNNQINYINNLLGTKFTPPDDNYKTILSTFLEARAMLASKELSYKVLSDSKKNIDLLHEIDNKNPGDHEFSQKAFQIEEYWEDYTGITKQIEAPVLTITGKKDHSVGEDHFLSFHFKNKNIKKINGGHLLYYENNKKFRNSIFQFIKETNKI